MSASTSRSETALDFIRNMKDFRQDIDIEYTIQILTKDLKGDNIGSFSNYLDEIVSVFPPKQLAEFISKLAKITRPIEVANKIAIFLLNHARPLFQIQGVFMVENLGDEGFIPLVVKHIYSTHKPLQKKAIKLVINLQGNAEEILESHIKSKSERKRKIAYRVLRCLNPDNIKLCFEALESEDFIVRSEAIKKIGNTKRKKY